MDNHETGSGPGEVSKEAPENVLGQSASVGTILREARERAGLSLDEVVHRIKFAPRQVASLEADDFTQLPEPAFVRGFVRSYARLLQLDPEPLLAALPHAPAQPLPAAEQTMAEVPFPNVYSVRRYNIIWLAAGLVVAIALGLFTWLHRSKPSEPAEPQPPAASEVKVENLELPSMMVLPASEVQPASAPSGAAGTPQAATPPADLVAQGAAAPPKAAPAAPVQQGTKLTNSLPGTSLRLDASTVSVPPSNARPAPAASGGASAPELATEKPGANAAAPKKPASPSASTGAIHMTFDGDSWVEVRDRDGTILLSQINPRGSELNLNGQPPLTLVIGNAAATHLTFKGKQVDLAAHTKGSTARLTLE